MHFHRFRNKRGLILPDTQGSFWKLTFPGVGQGPDCARFCLSLWPRHIRRRQVNPHAPLDGRRHPCCLKYRVTAPCSIVWRGFPEPVIPGLSVVACPGRPRNRIKWVRIIAGTASAVSSRGFGRRPASLLRLRAGRSPPVASTAPRARPWGNGEGCPLPAGSAP